MKKCLVAVVALFVIFFGLSFCQAKENGAMTKAEFVDVLSRVLNITLPEGSGDLSEAEIFKMQADKLAEKGITLFVGAKPDEVVTSGLLCSVLGNPIHEVPDDMGVTMVPTRGSISNVFNNALSGYRGQESVNEMSTSISELGCPPEDENKIMEFSEVIDALNIPALSAVVAEAYTPPGGTPIAGSPQGPQSGIGFQVPAQNPIPEDLKDTVASFASDVQ